MNKYQTEQSSQTSSDITPYILADNILKQLRADEPRQTNLRYSIAENYILDRGDTPHTFDSRRSILTGAYPSSSQIEFENIITGFFATLSSTQEPLGSEFEKVLFDNLWDLYQN
jgi:hypothetical protein